METMIFEDYLLQVESMTYEEFKELSQMERRELERSYKAYVSDKEGATNDAGK